MNSLLKILLSFLVIIIFLGVSTNINTDAKTPDFKRTIDKNHQEYEYTQFSFVKPNYSKEFKGYSWSVIVPGAIVFSIEKQTKEGYYDSMWISVIGEPVLKFPIKKNTTWKAGEDKRKIISTRTTVKTKYKTFKNAVKVQIGKASKKDYEYFVPNYGMVKETSAGKVLIELVRVGKQNHF